MFTELPSSPACERNKGPIWEVLQDYLDGLKRVIEIGSGTGEHARFFCEQNKDLIWQATDRTENLWMIEAHREAAQLPNFCAPWPLDVTDQSWPELSSFDGVYTANSLHIMSWEAVQCFFKALKATKEQSLLFIYGPMKYRDRYTSPSNKEFDEFLRSRDPKSGIRNFYDLVDLAQSSGFQFEFDHNMPANNQLLGFKKSISNTQ